MSASKPISRDDLLATIRAAVKEAGGKPPTLIAFLRNKKITRHQFQRYFSRWDEALTAAGFDFGPQSKRISTELLLADWGEITRKFQRIPSTIAYKIHGKYGHDVFYTRFGSYRNVAPAFKKFANDNAEWADVLAICSKRQRDGRSRPLPPHRLRQMWMRRAAGKPASDRPIYGTPLHLPGLCNAPVNETGVVFLFGIMAGHLGFHVQSLRVAFPDCTALREVFPGEWQSVSIEFEYESRNFREHNHDPKGCDFIVCWTHNWEDCPRSIEVIALKEELEQMDDSGIELKSPRHTQTEGCSHGPVGRHPRRRKQIRRSFDVE